MTDEERKTMIAMAAAIDALRKDVDALMGKTVPTAPGTGPLVSTIEHKLATRSMRFDVLFENYDLMPYTLRMEKNEQFLRDMLELLDEYRVTSLKGNYGTQLPQA